MCYLLAADLKLDGIKISNVHLVLLMLGFQESVANDFRAYTFETVHLFICREAALTLNVKENKLCVERLYTFDCLNVFINCNTIR